MSLSRAQYDGITRKYDQIRLSRQRELDLRKKEVYTKLPRLLEIENLIASHSVMYAKQLLNGNVEDKSVFSAAISELKTEKAALMRSSGYPDGYLEMEYSCPNCNDTGYVNGRKCHCFIQEIVNILYDQSNIKEILEKENFNAFSYKYYSDSEINRITGTTPLKNIQKVVAICKSFIQNFGTDYDNLFFYGESGTGKTFLCNCIAKELIENSYSVVYLSAIRLFDLLSEATFRRGSESENAEYFAKHLLTCDLLIIDDLGTELVNSFTSSVLFNCINERYLNKRPIIMSTNLSIEELQKTYSERTFSRITSNYSMLKIFGDDIRVKKKLEG